MRMTREFERDANESGDQRRAEVSNPTALSRSVPVPPGKVAIIKSEKLSKDPLAGA